MVLCGTIGTRSMEDGFHLVIAHIDAPRLDIRPNPLYEAAHFSLLKTHYYGGIRKYQWATMPLAIHGVFTRADGHHRHRPGGRGRGRPRLLHHRPAAPPERRAEQARALGRHPGRGAEHPDRSNAVEDEEIKEKVKLQTMILLHEKYGITEKDFTRAELEIVPATPARDIGFDRSMVGGYGQDDRVDAYAALRAEIEVKDPAFTTICVLADKGRDRQLRHHRHGPAPTPSTGCASSAGCRARTTSGLSGPACACRRTSPPPTTPPGPAPSSLRTAPTPAVGVAFFKYTGSRGKRRRQRRFRRADGLSDPDDGRRRRGLADRRAGPHRPGRRRHRGHRGGPQRHRRGGHRACRCCPCTRPSRWSARTTCTWPTVPSAPLSPQNSKHKRGSGSAGAPLPLPVLGQARSGRPEQRVGIMTKLIRFVKQEAVLSVAAVLAVVSAFFVPPGWGHTLATSTTARWPSSFP